MLKSSLNQILNVIKGIFIGAIIGIIIGIISSLLCTGDKQDVALEVKPGDIDVDFDSTETIEKILDKKDYPGEFTISTPEGDIRIGSTTPYGEIPPIETRWSGKQDLLINDKLTRGDYDGLIIHTGKIHRLYLRFDPITTRIDIPRLSPFNLYVVIKNRLDQNVKWHGALGTNLWYKNFALGGAIAIDPVRRAEETEYKISFLIDFSYRYKIF